MSSSQSDDDDIANGGSSGNMSNWVSTGLSSHVTELNLKEKNFSGFKLLCGQKIQIVCFLCHFKLNQQS